MKVLEECLVLISDSREEARLSWELAQLEQQREIEQTRQQALALLAKVSG